MLVSIVIVLYPFRHTNRPALLWLQRPYKIMCATNVCADSQKENTVIDVHQCTDTAWTCRQEFS